MELDFDKEIDTLLRKARSETEAATAVPVSAHFDADEIAAFAENALPEKIRQTYIMHFAECDRCRKILSQSILLNVEAVQDAAPLIAAPVVETIPWYRNMLRLPVLAYTMGTLTLLFSGFLGYMVWQNTNGSRSSEVSQVSDRSMSNAAPAANTAVASPTASTA